MSHPSPFPTLMSYHHSIRDIEQHTGLGYEFIRRVLKEIPELLDEYAIKGPNNANLFNENGLVCFREIAKMRAENYTLPSIRRKLLAVLPNRAQQPPNSPTEAQPNRSAQPADSLLLEFMQVAMQSKDEVIKAQQDALAAIQAKDDKILQLEKHLLLLTDGKSPEETQEALRQQEAELSELRQAQQAEAERAGKRQGLVTQLEQLGWYQGRKRRRLVEQLKALEKGNAARNEVRAAGSSGA